MSFRTIAAGAGMLAAFTLATTASAPAQTSGSAASASSVHVRAAKPQHRVVRKQREAAKARRVKRRLALTRHRHRSSDESADDTTRRATAPVRETAAAPHRPSSASRRFREFLNPQSFALSVSEELRGPRLLAAHFSGEISDPEVVLASLTPMAAGDRPERAAAAAVAPDQTTADETPASAPVLAQTDPAPAIQRAAPAQKQPDHMSFLRWFFVAWGGVLCFASAVRMAVG